MVTEQSQLLFGGEQGPSSPYRPSLLGATAVTAPVSLRHREATTLNKWLDNNSDLRGDIDL